MILSPTYFYYRVLFWISLILCGMYNLSISQTIPSGIPPIRNFTKKVYQAAPQNWDIARSRNQVMYFANNIGLLTFDGTFWQTHPIGNKTILRSVCVLDDGRIMAGGQGEIGWFKSNNSGILEYSSLTAQMPEAYKNFEDVWQIFSLGKQIFLNTSREVFIWDDVKMQVHPFNGRIEKIEKVNNVILLYEENGGLYLWKNNRFEKIAPSLPTASPVTGIISGQKSDTLIVSTMKDGLFYFAGGKWGKMDTPWNTFFMESWVNQIIVLADGNIAVGTAQNGLLVFHPDKKSSMYISLSQGIQSNNVLSLYQDPIGDLWVCTEQGIDLIQYHAPYRMVFPDGALKGAGYAAAVHQNKLYLGTTNGLFRHDHSHSRSGFYQVSGTKGQVWKLDTLFGKLFLGHHEGAFEVSNEGLKTILKGTGAWKFTGLGDRDLLIGTYEGVGLYQKDASGYRGKILAGFEESSRIMVKDQQNELWMSHPYRGVFKLKIDIGQQRLEAVKMGKDQGLVTDLGHYIYQIHNETYLSSEDGIYVYSRERKKFESDSLLESQIGRGSRIQLLYEDPTGNIWFHTPEETGLLEIIDKGLEKEVRKRILPAMPEKMLGGFEFIFALDNSHYLFGCEQGFTLLDMEALKQNNQYETLISAVYLATGSDSILYKGHMIGEIENKAGPLFLSPSQNAIRFNFTSTSFGEELREFRYQLEGLDNSFSEWTTNPEIQFNNLQPGEYKFIVQSRVGGQVQQSEAQYEFMIITPWYRLKMVQGLGILGIVLLILLFFFLQRKKFESEKQEMESLHMEQVEQKTQLVEKTEQEITLLKNEKLQAEIQHKNNELASTTMHLVQKQELLSTIENELKKLLKHKEYPSMLRHDIQSVAQMLQEDARIDEDWEKFSSYFDEVHGFFLQKLREKYPHLTANDHKLCAYLRMNLSTKEIASLMNISVRGVEGSRYRLRKKLDLDADANLQEFMLNVTKEVDRIEG